jgi:predicted nucleic acid-binding protein
MNASKFFASPPSVLVADASIVINLNASGRASEIIRALPHRVVVTDNAITELEAGERNGHRDAGQLRQLIDAGLVARVEIGGIGAGVYENLINGSARLTLDDGEAATIACAVELGGFALLDERKARSLCATSFSSLPLGCSAELLMHPTVSTALASAHIATVVRALQVGRMRVPPEFVSEIASLIGPEHAGSCMSLPKILRRTA